MSKSIRRKRLKYKYWCNRHPEKAPEMTAQEIREEMRAVMFQNWLEWLMENRCCITTVTKEEFEQITGVKI